GVVYRTAANERMPRRVALAGVAWTRALRSAAAAGLAAWATRPRRRARATTRSAVGRRSAPGLRGGEPVVQGGCDGRHAPPGGVAGIGGREAGLEAGDHHRGDAVGADKNVGVYVVVGPHPAAELHVAGR